MWLCYGMKTFTWLSLFPNTSPDGSQGVKQDGPQACYTRQPSSTLLAGFFLPPIPLHTFHQLDARSTKAVEGTTNGEIDFTLTESLDGL